MHLEVMNESRLDGVIEKSNLAQTFWKIVVKHRKKSQTTQLLGEKMERKMREIELCVTI